MTEEVLYRHNRVRVVTGEDVCGSMGSDVFEPIRYFRVERREPSGWETMAAFEAPLADRPLVAETAREALRQADEYDI